MDRRLHDSVDWGKRCLALASRGIHSRVAKSVSAPPLAVFLLLLGAGFLWIAKTRSEQAGIEAWLNEHPVSKGLVQALLQQEGLEMSIDPTEIDRAFKDALANRSHQIGTIYLSPHRSEALWRTGDSQWQLWKFPRPAAAKPSKDWVKFQVGWAEIEKIHNLVKSFERLTTNLPKAKKRSKSGVPSDPRQIPF